MNSQSSTLAGFIAVNRFFRKKTNKSISRPELDMHIPAFVGSFTSRQEDD